MTRLHTDYPDLEVLTPVSTDEVIRRAADLCHDDFVGGDIREWLEETATNNTTDAARVALFDVLLAALERNDRPYDPDKSMKLDKAAERLGREFQNWHFDKYCNLAEDQLRDEGVL